MMKWYALTWEEIVSLFEGSLHDKSLSMKPILSVLYMQCDETQQQQLIDTYPNIVNQLDTANAQYNDRKRLQIRTLNLLTDEELKQIEHLRKEMNEAKTSNEVKDYSNQISSILDDAEKRKQKTYN